MTRATVQLISRGEEYPYVLEVATPGWCGVNEAFKVEEGQRLKDKFPDDLKQIFAVLRKAGVTASKTLFMAEGTTELVLKDFADFEIAVTALHAAGWIEGRSATERTSQPALA